MKVEKIPNADSKSWLTDRIPIKQGLKDSRGEYNEPVKTLTDRIPIKQGLKVKANFKTLLRAHLTDRIPIKQGLKVRRLHK